MRIAVFNQKGGVGKTTTTLNRAAASYRDGGQPLLLDLDPQCHLSGIHGHASPDVARSLFGFYQGLRNLDALIIPWEGIGRLIPSHQQLIKVDSIFGKGPTVLNKLRHGLEEIGVLDLGGQHLRIIRGHPGRLVPRALGVGQFWQAGAAWSSRPYTIAIFPA